MLQHLKRICRPTTFLLVVWFAISLTSVLIGISSINAIMLSLSEIDSETPIYFTIQNTRLSLTLAIYIFSIANYLVMTNYWIVTQRHDMAVYKAFGWSNRHDCCGYGGYAVNQPLYQYCFDWLFEIMEKLAFFLKSTVSTSLSEPLLFLFSHLLCVLY